MRIKTKATFAVLMQKLVQEYRDAGNPWPATKTKIAQWAIKNRKWHRHKSALVQLCAADIARALRQEYYTDPQGRRVRTKIAARFPKENFEGIDQWETLWGDVRSVSRDFAEVGFSGRRSQVAGEAKQLGTDIDSYNDNHNDGEPIPVNLDFQTDYEESKQATTYNFGRVK